MPIAVSPSLASSESAMMLKSSVYRISRQLLLAGSVAVVVLAPVASKAQVSGYPVDPSEQMPSDGQTSTNRRPSSNRTANDAAADQTSVPISTSERYRPDFVEDNSQGNNDQSRSQGQSRNRSRTSSDDGTSLTDQDELTRSIRRPARPSEFETYVSQSLARPLRRFGANLLVPEARNFTAPPTTTIPSDYRLNPGDELLVGLTGSVEASNLRLTIDSEGRIFLPKVGPVTVGGARYGDIQSLIARQVSRQYRNFRVAVSIARLHGITVYITGYAAAPGSYTLSSLSTLVNAVLIAGGPSGGGSFRSIQVRRNGRLISDFDLYNLLLKGDKSADVLLQGGDVIYIAPAGSQVAVIGSVNVEAIYEARAEETLNDMLLYAGGVNTVADSSRLLLLDPLKPGGWQQLTPTQVTAQIASRGEIVRVLSGVGIAQPLFTLPALVTVSGEVAKPGRYYVQPGSSLGSVLAQAGGLTAQAFPYATVFTRESVQQTQRLSYERALRDLELLLSTKPLVSSIQPATIDPTRLAAVRSVVDQLEARKPDGRMVLNVAPADRSLQGDIVLENNDSIYVPPRPVTVGVFGSVPSPASFQYTQNATIGDFLRRAGGVQKLGDASGIFVVRANGTLLARGRGATRGNILKTPAYPGDLIFVPIDANRGEFWAKLQALSSVLFPAVIATAAITK